MAQADSRRYSERAVRQRQEQLRELAAGLLRSSPADETELVISEHDSALTRFAGSSIHQNTLERGASATLSTRLGQREGRAVTSSISSAGLTAALEQALAAAKASPVDPYMADLPTGPCDYPFQLDFHEATAACTPQERARQVVAGFEAGEPTGLSAAGFLSTAAQQLLIANNRGMEVCLSTTLARYNMLWSGPDSSGFAEGAARSLGELDVPALSVEAQATARHSVNPRSDLPAGEFTVVLGPQASATLLSFLASLAFSGRAFVDGQSALSGRLGTPVCGNNITIHDDPWDPRLLSFPCDARGAPKQRLGLIEGGVARAVAHDPDSAKRAGTASTAHSTEMRYPLPTSLVLAPGGSSREQLISEVEHGVYVSRFHYTNALDPLATTVTGMTRDGTFLIEHGKLAGGLTNFRFTQAILPALGAVSGIASEQRAVTSPWGGWRLLLPEALRIERFNFSSKSDH